MAKRKERPEFQLMGDRGIVYMSLMTTKTPLAISVCEVMLPNEKDELITTKKYLSIMIDDETGMVDFNPLIFNKTGAEYLVRMLTEAIETTYGPSEEKK